MKMALGRTAFVKLSIITVFICVFAVLTLIGNQQRAAASAYGPTPSHTSAPGEANCTACHTDYAVNSGEGMVEISGIPATYTSGQQFNIVVTATQLNAVIYGFQFTAIDSTGQKVGTYDIPAASEDRIQLLQGLVGQNMLREYMEHKSGGLSNGQFGFNSWQFNWTAPSTSVGRVDFYATANCANSDGNTSGDYIYATTTATVPAASTPISISGKVTTPTGLPLRNTKVILTDPANVQTPAFTSSFGIYSFTNVPSGANYTISVQSKRYRFSPKVMTPSGNLTNVDFVGLE
ncbi:MAG: carboxypeptidase regulatory-like domain-containing protein [Pyrinomonadaceae bacterium]